MKFVTLTTCSDTRLLMEGMAVRVGEECARVKHVDHANGYLVLHRPWWWRLLIWVKG